MVSGSSESAKRVAAPASLKPQDYGSIDESWLKDFDSERSEYLLRLETDRSIIEELRGSDFAGLHYDYFATEIAKYGIAVMTAWVRTHQIFPKMRSRGIGGLPLPRGDELRVQENAQELAMETVAAALKNFRTYVLLPGRWDPNRGASIRTYFIGQCLIQFANVYRRWHKETYVPEWESLDGHPVAAAHAWEHVEKTVEDQIDVRNTLESVKKRRTKEVFVLRAAGYSHEEIAIRLGITTKAVEMTVRNERNRQMKEQAG